MAFDGEKLISHVKSRPALWDIFSPEYHDKLEKLKYWEEIVDLFVKPGRSESERIFWRRNLQTKWKNIRDTYIKECRGQTKPDPRRKSLYKHYQQLQFLRPTIMRLQPSKRTRNEEETDTRKKSIETSRMKSDCKSGKNSQDVRQDQNSDDPDRHFMLSLVSDFKRVPDKLKCVVKMNILKCIIDAQENYVEMDGNTAEEAVATDLIDVKSEMNADDTQSDQNDASSTSSDDSGHFPFRVGGA